MHHIATPFIAVASPFVAYLLSWLALEMFGFEFGFFILLLNGSVTFIGLLTASLFTKN
ncbi:hypothetical protein JCM19314_40 [Nonlabens ulvanivorans]|uniref:Uncharacterized protein n=1 Tax=Nonlabens ulvanivorans TaxID=906888 RepID=A0A090QG93_NONUL|nr:hypothetical protein JCM19314_40 [Nonlabens ulvanivorans]